MRQLFWYSLQIAVAAPVFYWAAMTEEGRANGGDNPYAVTALVLIAMAAVTAAVMIARDVTLFLVRLWRPRQIDETDDGSSRLPAAAGLGEPRKLTTGIRIGKQAR